MSLPSGLTQPIPVMTTRRRMVSASAGGLIPTHYLRQRDGGKERLRDGFSQTSLCLSVVPLCLPIRPYLHGALLILRLRLSLRVGIEFRQLDRLTLGRAADVVHVECAQHRDEAHRLEKGAAGK